MATNIWDNIGSGNGLLPYGTKPLPMMTSSNGNIFRVTGHLCGEFTGLRWIPHTKASDAEPWINGWVNNREAGDLRRYRAHYDVSVMWTNVHLSSETSSGIHLRAISQEITSTINHWNSLENYWFKFNSNFPAANELMSRAHEYNIFMSWFICSDYISMG